jgi:predicted enzyme related to lactoylglutathione lyase
MRMTSLHCRLATMAAMTATLLGCGFSTSARAADFPPLNEPSSIEVHAGKFIWAELFATDPDAATKFYAGVFGWTAAKVEQGGETYTVFSNGGHPVAGLRQRSNAAAGHSSRWIGYISVSNLDLTLANVTKAGGEIRAPARAFPKIGLQAIFTDKDGAPVGLVQSSSGSSPDADPLPGDWNWFHLFAKSPPDAAAFYRDVFHYVVAPDTREGKGHELLLATGAFNRGGISVLPEGGDAKPGWLGVIRVAKLDETLARVPALGGEVTTAPHDAAFGSRFAIIVDPTGGSVGVVEYVKDANPVNRP